MVYDRMLACKEIIQRTQNVKSFRVEAGDDVAFKAGQFVCVWLNADPAFKRYLSISNSPTEKGYIEFTKKLTASDFSRALDSLRPGDKLRVQFPMGNFTLRQEDGKIAFLSGGIGITPIRSMFKYSVDKGLPIDIVLLYANRTSQDIVFKEDFEAMAKQSKTVKVVHVLCEPAADLKCTVGVINGQVIKNEVPDYLQRTFYLCGPPGMVEAMKKILSEELNLPQQQIVTENFVGY